MTDSNTIDLFTNELTARQVHERLTELLTPELNKDMWIRFVETAYHYLPQLNNAEGGRIPEAVIANSFVGRLGFKSWKEYVEADPKRGGLGWTATGWKRHKQAYSILSKHGWLRQAEMSVEQVRGLEREYKDHWPETLADHRVRQSVKAQAKESERLAKAAERQKQIEKLATLPALESKIQLLEADKARLVAESETQRDSLNQQIGKLTTQIENLEAQLTEAKKPKPKPQRLDYWPNLKRALKNLWRALLRF